MANFATEPTAQVTPMTVAEMALGLTCGELSIGQLNWLFSELFGQSFELLGCDGNPLPSNAQVVTCSELTDAIAAIPTDNYLTGLGGYNAATNVLTLNMEDGSTVNVDMTDLVADAVESVPHVSATVIGLVNNTALQELGGVDKTVNGVRVGRGNVGDVSSTVVGSSAGQAATGTDMTAVGRNAGRDNTGASVSFFGRSAGQGNTGGLSVLVGVAAGASNIGAQVTSLGHSAGQFNNGSSCTHIGALTGRYSSGTASTYVGAKAGVTASAGSCTGLGVSACENATASFITGVGAYAARAQHGSGFTALGANAGSGFVGAGSQAVTSVDVALNRFTVPSHGFTGNVVLRVTATTAPAPLSVPEFYTFQVIDANTLQINNYDITTTGVDVAVNTNTLNNHSNSTAIGFNSNTTADNQVVLGGVGVVEVRTSGVYYGAAFNVVSDKRNKVNIEKIDLEAAAKLSREVSFLSFDVIQSQFDFEIQESLAGKDEKGKAYQRPVRRAIAQGAGIVAQDLQNLLKEIGQWEWLVQKDKTTGDLTVDYTSLFAILAAGFQHRLDKAGI